MQVLYHAYVKPKALKAVLQGMPSYISKKVYVFCTIKLF